MTANNIIYDCGNPFLIDANNKALICDYIYIIYYTIILNKIVFPKMYLKEELSE